MCSTHEQTYCVARWRISQYVDIHRAYTYTLCRQNDVKQTSVDVWVLADMEEIRVDVTNLQGVLTKFHKALDKVILCFSQQLLDRLTTFG